MENQTENIATEQQGIAGEQEELAQQTAASGSASELGDFLGAVLKGATAVSCSLSAPVPKLVHAGRQP
jgi:hypothetical protein